MLAQRFNVRRGLHSVPVLLPMSERNVSDYSSTDCGTAACVQFRDITSRLTGQTVLGALALSACALILIPIVWLQCPHRYSRASSPAWDTDENAYPHDP
jgi:hypothetical protein